MESNPKLDFNFKELLDACKRAEEVTNVLAQCIDNLGRSLNRGYKSEMLKKVKLFKNVNN